MDAKFTKGPWLAEMRYIHDIPGNARVEVVAASKHEDHSSSAVASICYSHTPCKFYIDDKGEAEATARLIAAAPELLEALHQAVECGMVPTSSTKDGGANKHVRQIQVADMIRAAIAKATGDDQ